MRRSPAESPSLTSHLSPMARSTLRTRCSTLSSALTTIAVGLPLVLRVTPCCGTRIALSCTPSSMMARTYMPGSRTNSGFGKTARTVMEPVLCSTVHVGKLEGPLHRVFSPVLQQEPRPGLPRAVGLERSFREDLLQMQHFGARLDHVHVDGIELLDCGQREALTRRDPGRRRSPRICRSVPVMGDVTRV